MSVYAEILSWISRAYRDAGNEFRAPGAMKKINDVLAGLETTLERLDRVAPMPPSGQGAGGTPSPTAMRDAMLLLGAQFKALESAVASAAVGDDAKIRSHRVDQLAQRRRADIQQAADGKLLSEVNNLILQVSGDAAAAGSGTMPVAANPGGPYATRPNVSGGYG